MRATTAVSQTESYIFINYLITRRDNNETLDRVVVVVVVSFHYNKELEILLS